MSKERPEREVAVIEQRIKKSIRKIYRLRSEDKEQIYVPPVQSHSAITRSVTIKESDSAKRKQKMFVPEPAASPQGVKFRDSFEEGFSKKFIARRQD